MDGPDEKTLRLLILIGSTGSLTSASTSMGISQQAASTRIRLLERKIGTALLLRSARGSTLTPTGQLVAGWATDFVAAADVFTQSIAALRSDVAADLTIASSLTIAEHLLPRWLVKLRAQRETRGEPTSVTMLAANSEGVAQLVRTRSVVLGFIESPDVPNDLESRPVARDELILVVHPDHEWAQKGKPVDPAEISRTVLVTRERGSGTRLALERSLSDLPEPVALNAASIELPSNAAIRASVAAGLAPAVLSVLAVADDLALGRVVRVPMTGLTITRPLSAIWVRGTTLPRAALELLDLVAVTA